MECYRVQIPEGVKVAGVTAAGSPAIVLPGEYLVHQLNPKVKVGAQPVLRFVGADPLGYDVHVPLEAGSRLGEGDAVLRVLGPGDR